MFDGTVNLKPFVAREEEKEDDVQHLVPCKTSMMRKDVLISMPLPSNAGARKTHRPKNVSETHWEGWFLQRKDCDFKKKLTEILRK